ncbi:hypothetical protein [Consotaella salsifontis]|nr:hypothetical protein [Consotaella salsifontis]
MTETGQRLIADRTEALVAGLLGPDYTVDLDDQHVGVGEHGNLLISWSTVEVGAADAANPPVRIGGLAIALKIWPLLTADLAIETLDIRDAMIDIAALTPNKAPPTPQTGEATPGTLASSEAASPVSLPDIADGLVATLERQTGVVDRLGLKNVSLEAVELSGLDRIGSKLPSARIDRLSIERNPAGVLRLAGVAQVDGIAVPLSGRLDRSNSGGALRHMDLAVGPLGLAKIAPPSTEPDDRRPLASDASLAIAASLDRSAEGDPYRLSASATLGAGTLQIGKARTGIERVRLGLSYTEGDEKVVIADSPMAFDAVSLNLVGEVVPQAAPAEGGPPRAFDIHLKTRDLTSTVGQQGSEPEKADLAIDARLDLSRSELLLDRFELRPSKGTLMATGEARFGRADGPVRAVFEGRDLSTRSVKAFWPFLISSSTRSWILDHFADDGGVPRATIALEFTKRSLATALDPENDPGDDELTLDAEVAGAAFSTLGEMPAFTDVSGAIHLKGATTVVSVDKAALAEFPKVTVEPSSILFTKEPDRSTRADLQLGLHGDARDLLTIADREPVNALDQLDFTPADVAGEAGTKVAVTFLLGQGIDNKDRLVDWKAALDLHGVDFAKPIEGNRISGLVGTGTVLPDRITAELSGKLGDLPVTYSIVRPVGRSSEVAERLTIGLLLSAEDVERALPGLSPIANGPVTGSIVHEAAVDHVALDLKETELGLPWVGWKKGRGIDASVTFDLVGEGETHKLDRFALKGAGFELHGSMTIDDKGLRAGMFDRIALNQDDEITLRLERVSNGLTIRVGGKRFDARSLLKDIREDLSSDLSDKAKRKSDDNDQLDIEVSIDQVTGFNGLNLFGLAMNYAGSSQEIAALSAVARTAEGGKVTVDVSPRGGAQSMTVTSQDTGALLSFSGLYNRMRGGQGSFSLVGSRRGGYRGRVELRNFTLVDEPRLSSLVSTPPSEGEKSLAAALGRDIPTAEAFFDQASANITYGAGRVMVDDGIVRGPVFGSSFSGTLHDEKGRIDIAGSFMPAYGINRVFGAIPFFGQILGNGNEGGLIGITYRLSGAFASPDLSINPISVIAPGIFRRIFEY